MYYYDVHLFLSQAKVIIMIKIIHLIYISLYICFCDFTQQWYVTELSDLQQNSLHEDLSIKNWVQTLMTWFKQSEQVILDVLLALWFILNNLQNNHNSLMAYVQAMIQNRRNADLLTLNQLSLIWNKLNSKLQHDVLQLRYDTTVTSFIEQLKKHKDIWKCLFSQFSYWYEQWDYELQS